MSTSPMDILGCYVSLTDTDQTRRNTVQIFFATSYKSMKFYLGGYLYNTITLLWIIDEKRKTIKCSDI